MIARFWGYLSLILSIGLYALSDGDSLHSYYLIVVGLIIFTVMSALSTERNQTLKSFWLRPSIFCLLGLVIVGLQLFIDSEIGFSNIETTTIQGAKEYSDKCFFSICTFILCYLISNYSCNKPLLLKSVQDERADLTYLWIGVTAAVFVWFVFTIDIIAFITGAIYHEGGAYDSIYGLSNSLEGLYQTFFYITLASVTIKIKKSNVRICSLLNYFKSFPKPFLIIVLLYLFIRLFSGDRGPVIYNSLALLYSYIFISKHRFNLISVLTFIFVGAFVVSLWGVFRSRSTTLTIREKIVEAISLKDDFREKSFSPSTSELASSLKTHFIAVRDIEKDKTDFSYGRYVLFSFTGAVPGLKKEYIYDMGFNPEDVNSADYITISHQGRQFTYGNGSSAFAESYLEFGILGMVLFGLLFGYILKQIDYFYISDIIVPVPLLAVILKISAQAVYLGRSSFAIELGSILHMLVYYYIIYFFLRLIRK